jgi:hypothetical protein
LTFRMPRLQVYLDRYEFALADPFAGSVARPI